MEEGKQLAVFTGSKVNYMKFIDIILLTEAIKIDSADDAVKLIKTKQIGVKVDPSIFNIPDEKLKGILNLFINECNQKNIKEIVYGIQFLVSHSTADDIEDIVSNGDAFYYFLESYKKPWIKQLPMYSKFINGKYDPEIWNTFAEQILKGQDQHGLTKKGKGKALDDVKTIYNDGTWTLQIPSSFEGEKAAAYYGTPGNEQVTNWCTRVNKEFWDRYSKNGSQTVYIIKNHKTGKSYQAVFEKNYVNLFNQFDKEGKEGDEVTAGDLTGIPDKILSLIKNNTKESPTCGKTLLDYKKSNYNSKDFINKERITHSYDEENNELYLSKSFSSGYVDNFVLGKISDIGHGVNKAKILNIKNYDSDDDDNNALQNFFRKAKNVYACLYWIGNNKKISILAIINNDVSLSSKGIKCIKSSDFINYKANYKDVLLKAAMNDSGCFKKDQRDNNRNQNIKNKINMNHKIINRINERLTLELRKPISDLVYDIFGKKINIRDLKVFIEEDYNGKFNIEMPKILYAKTSSIIMSIYPSWGGNDSLHPWEYTFTYGNETKTFRRQRDSVIYKKINSLFVKIQHMIISDKKNYAPMQQDREESIKGRPGSAYNIVSLEDINFSKYSNRLTENYFNY